MSYWGPKLPLELREGSLLPAIGLSSHVAIAVQVMFAIFALSFALWRLDDPPLYLVLWLYGAFAIRYVTARLAGRPAVYTLHGDVLVEKEAPFQWRVIVDALMIACILFSIVAIAFGMESLEWLFGEA